MISLQLAAGVTFIILMGALLQTSVGFGMGLLSVPLLIGLGLPLPSAVAIYLGATLVHTALCVYSARKRVDSRGAMVVGAAQVLGIPIGVGAMAYLADVPTPTLRVAVGIVVVVLVSVRLVSRPAPQQQLGARWGLLAGASSGLLSGLVGMGGPPLVLYALSRPWSKDQFRVFLWTQFLIGGVVLAGMLLVQFGLGLLPYLAAGAACTPVVWLGMWLGLAVTERWEMRHLVSGAIISLYAVALAGIFGL